MKIQRVEEFLLSPEQRKAITKLLQECFPEYPPNQTYYKQLPDFRFLANDGKKLIAHMAVEHRLINNGDRLVRILGVADLCVAAAYQHQKIASQLLNQLKTLGQKNGVDFILLIAKDHDLYLSNGFQLVPNSCRWVIINKNKTFGIVQRKLERSLMVKPLGQKKWETGQVDLMGHIF